MEIGRARGDAVSWDENLRTLTQTTADGLSDLWSSGFNPFHGKFNALREGRTWLPALSRVPARSRWQRRLFGVFAFRGAGTSGFHPAGSFLRTVRVGASNVTKRSEAVGEANLRMFGD
jgi:hypothetical protein